MNSERQIEEQRREAFLRGPASLFIGPNPECDVPESFAED